MLADELAPASLAGRASTRNIMTGLYLRNFAFKTRQWSELSRYFGCVLIVSVVLSIEYLMWSGPGYPFILSLLAVVISAVLFGRRTGVFATAACALVSIYLFIEPIRSVSFDSIDDALAFLSFVGIGLFSSFVIAGYHDATILLTEANTRLHSANELLRATDEEKDTLLQEMTHRAQKTT
jgi:K+-sensing histidine kinase KdpD